MNTLLTTKELAEKLGVSERHVYRQRAAGKFPRPKRIGKCVRWNPDDFQDWFERGKNDNKPKK
jgi:excisionase family DNA binding protein